MAYPTLTVNPNFPIDESEEDIAIKSKFEAGYQAARARNTNPRKNFKINYTMLSLADKTSLKNHWDSVKNITPFDWTHPVTATVYTVRFQSPFTFQNAQYQRYNCSFILEQV